MEIFSRLRCLAEHLAKQGGGELVESGEARFQNGSEFGGGINFGTEVGGQRVLNSERG